MRRGFLVSSFWIFSICCAGQHVELPAVDAPLPVNPPLNLNDRLPDETRICVTRELFIDRGYVCITVGELRSILRHQRPI